MRKAVFREVHNINIYFPALIFQRKNPQMSNEEHACVQITEQRTLSDSYKQSFKK